MCTKILMNFTKILVSTGRILQIVENINGIKITQTPVGLYREVLIQGIYSIVRTIVEGSLIFKLCLTTRRFVKNLELENLQIRLSKKLNTRQ